MNKIPIYDIECTHCGDIEKDVWLKIDEEIPECPACGDIRKKLCNCNHFKLEYNSKTDSCGWGDQNYESTQRYRYVNKSDVIE